MYKGIWWTIGRYDTVVLFEAKDEKAAMNMVLRRADRIDIKMLFAVPADAAHPCGPVEIAFLEYTQPVSGRQP